MSIHASYVLSNSAFAPNPEFVEGVEDGWQCYQECYADDGWPAPSMILQEIEFNLSPSALKREYIQLARRHSINFTPSPAYHLGWLLGWLGEYANAKETARCSKQ